MKEKGISRWLIKRFGYTKTEVNATLFIIPLTVAITIYNIFDMQSVPDHLDISKMRKLNKERTLSFKRSIESPNNQSDLKTSLNLTPFDPNKETAEGMSARGMPKFIAERIIKYREKGGGFKHAEDLRKIYGMDSVLFESLSDLIIINDQKKVIKKNEYTNVPNYKSEHKTSDRPFVLSETDINLTDTLNLKRVKGIGSKRAARIIAFRNALGGFHSLEQLREVYGLDSVIANELMQHFTVNKDFKPNIIDPRTDSIATLAAHPYISWNEARLIKAYFDRHQRVMVNDLHKIPVLDSLKIKKITPYLKFDQSP